MRATLRCYSQPRGGEPSEIPLETLQAVLGTVTTAKGIFGSLLSGTKAWIANTLYWIELEDEE